MSERIWEEPKAGEWVQPIPHGYLMKCCDCGLVHVVNFRVVKNQRRGNKATIQGSSYRVQMQLFREDAEATGGAKID